MRQRRRATAEPRALSASEVDAIEKRIQILLDSTRRERDRAAARMDGTQTRATVLIGAAGILGGIQGGAQSATAHLSSGWAIAGLALYVLAAVAGLMLLWPLKVLVVTNQEYFAKMSDYHPVDLQEALLRNELNAARHTQRRLTFRSWTLIAGFALLAAAWTCSLIGMIAIAADPPAEPPVKVEIVN